VNGSGVPIFKKQISNSAVSNESGNVMRRPFSPPLKNILPAPTEGESFLNQTKEDESKFNTRSDDKYSFK
jgi:hypothetical protein